MVEAKSLIDMDNLPKKNDCEVQDLTANASFVRSFWGVLFRVERLVLTVSGIRGKLSQK